VVKNLVLLGVLAAMVPTVAASQEKERERKYVGGIRSGLVTGTMELSGLDPAFGDLAADGPAGPHMSGFFLMYKVRPYLRVGIETLVASSDKGEATTMNYQAAGPVIELSYGKTWFVSGGVHGGGVIVNAMARQGAAPAEGATTGSYFKGDGVFLAPYVDVGRRIRRYEIGVFLKQVNIFGEKERGGLSDFSSTFVGLRFGLGL
jgi:hypothetical protein